MWSWIKELFSLWNFNSYSMIYVNFGGIRDPFLKQNPALQFCRNRNKDVNILTESHISLDQIHHIRNNWLGAIFPLLFTHRDCFSCFIWVLNASLRLKLIQIGSLCPLSLLPLMTEFSVFMPLQSIAPGNSWLGGASLKDYEII